MNDRNDLLERYRNALAANDIAWDEYLRTLRDDVIARETYHWETRAAEAAASRRDSLLPDRCTHPYNLNHTTFPGSGGGTRVIKKVVEQ